MKMKWIQKLRQIDIGISVIALVLLIAVTFAGLFSGTSFQSLFHGRKSAAGADHMGYFFRGKICI